VVSDASVILKWLLQMDDEPDTGKALLLRDAIIDEHVRVIVPTLWLFEVGNTVTRRFLSHGVPGAMMRFELEASSSVARDAYRTHEALWRDLP
jgi:hypothetical protein